MMPSNLEIEALLRQSQELREETIRVLCSSADPVRAELGREMAAGRVSTDDLVFGSAYRDLLETGLMAIADPPKEISPGQARPPDDDGENFSEDTFMERVR